MQRYIKIRIWPSEPEAKRKYTIALILQRNIRSTIVTSSNQAGWHTVKEVEPGAYMPGAYAHLTLVNLIREPTRLEIRGLTPEAIVPILDYFRFCELGAVSPDYPYLNLAHPDACQWADRMYYEKTGDMIKAGIDLVKKLNGASQQKTFA